MQMNPVAFPIPALAKKLWVLLVGPIVLLCSCGGGGSSSTESAQIAPLSGNWQFSLTPPADGSYTGGLQGGFFLQKDGAVNGQLVYSIYLPQVQTPCSSGSAKVSGMLAGNTVNLTAIAGSQTFDLTGTLSSDGSTMMGTFASTDGAGCGTAQTGLDWTATLVKPISGSFTGIFHSTLSGVVGNQSFAVTGSLSQGENIGASNATVTGTLNFNGLYPCMNVASINGTISGSSVVLQIIDSTGLTIGQIGGPAGSSHPSPVAFQNTSSGNMLQGTDGYGVSTTNCPAGNTPGDSGNICLSFGNDGCQQSITLTPPVLVFPQQALGATPSQQTIVVTNTDASGKALNNITIRLQNINSPFGGFSDFTGLPNFTEQDNCIDAPGGSFSLAPQQSCTVTIFFAPQQSCPWLPSASSGGTPPAQCPSFLTDKVIIDSPESTTTTDSNTTFVVPLTGQGLSTLIPSVPELDYGSQAPGETSPAQTVSFVNQGSAPVQILPAITPCTSTASQQLPRPLVPGGVSGIQGATQISADQGTIDYLCDVDVDSALPNFSISSDSCSGAVLAPQASCNVEVTFSPQPKILNPPQDFFLELNTAQCTTNITSDCEIDAGRFPVQLRANPSSPLRMTPGAGLDFGFQQVGLIDPPYPPMKVTIYNDPDDPNAGTINFTGNLVTGDYHETDDCGSSLAPGGNCTMSVYFLPTKVGYRSGTVTITYPVGQTQTIYMRGWGCTNCKVLPPGAN
ncbi:MAG TPA: choice-of-anchor D domain-containing protein [Terriglobales bacterium]|jgi:hypothetical protein